MEILTSSELMVVSGGKIRDSDQARAAKCRADIERAGDTGERMGGKLGRLLGSSWGIKDSKACQDQIRLSGQRDQIDRMRHAKNYW